jgi:asparagine N-glycosylation enzyme membrane subunit Stt3
VLLASRDNNVSKVIYASSSAVYGDTPTLPQKEDMVPQPLSPYAAAKLAGEHYYGYWITRSAHRIPNANPSQDPTALPRVATFFTSLDEESANKIAQELGSAYVILDYETASSKFWAVATWAGKPPTDFFANYWVPAENSQRTYIHTDYYRSLSSRLYNFDGKAVKPEKTLVIAYELRTTVDGLEYRELLSEKEFNSYEEAEAYIASQKSGNYRIVGTDPLLSPVPLEELKQYKLVYSSEETVASNHGPIPAVKVFEFTDRVSPYGK